MRLQRQVSKMKKVLLTNTISSLDVMNDTGIGAVASDAQNSDPVIEVANHVGSSGHGAEADEDSHMPAPAGPPQT